MSVNVLTEKEEIELYDTEFLEHIDKAIEYIHDCFHSRWLVKTPFSIAETKQAKLEPKTPSGEEKDEYVFLEVNSDTITTLVSKFKHPVITAIHFNDMDITPFQLKKFLLELLSKGTLVLEMEFYETNAFNKENVNLFAEFLKKNNIMNYLRVVDSYVLNDGAQIIAKALHGNRTIRYLSLRADGCTGGISSLVEQLLKNTDLHWLAGLKVVNHQLYVKLTKRIIDNQLSQGSNDFYIHGDKSWENMLEYISLAMKTFKSSQLKRFKIENCLWSVDGAKMLIQTIKDLDISLTNFSYNSTYGFTEEVNAILYDFIMSKPGASMKTIAHYKVQKSKFGPVATEEEEKMKCKVEEYPYTAEEFKTAGWKGMLGLPTSPTSPST